MPPIDEHTVYVWAEIDVARRRRSEALYYREMFWVTSPLMELGDKRCLYYLDLKHKKEEQFVRDALILRYVREGYSEEEAVDFVYDRLFGKPVEAMEELTGIKCMDRDGNIDMKAFNKARDAIYTYELT